MDLNAARDLIDRTRGQMDAANGAVLFDEWALIAIGGGAPARLLAYHGPRIENLRTRFVADSRPLAEELEGRRLEVGGFAFVPDAAGTAYDACVRIGERAYLWWNHTRSTMDEVRRSSGWLLAQRAFVAMCERFAVDPLDSV